MTLEMYMQYTGMDMAKIRENQRATAAENVKTDVYKRQINDRRRLQYGRGQKIVLAGKPSAGLAPFTSFGFASSAC